MVAYFVPWIWSAGAFIASGLIAQHYIMPKLPVYTMQVRNFPLLSLRKVDGHTALHTKIQADVVMQNQNYVPIDIHSMSFHVFYMDWQGKLEHLGQVHDRRQYQIEQQERAAARKKNHKSNNANKEMKITTVKSLTNTQTQFIDTIAESIKTVPIWKISARSNFTVLDDLYVDTFVSWSAFRVVTRLIYSWFTGYGSIRMPTAGIAHAKSRQSPLTVGIVCDNEVNTWTLKVTGLQCILHQVAPGWTNMTKSSQAIVNHVVNDLVANATGGVLQTASSTATLSWSDILSHVSIADTMLAAV